MGGGNPFKTPKGVWAPTGGWWAQPTHWKRNTAVAMAFVFVSTAFVWKTSDRLVEESIAERKARIADRKRRQASA